MVSLPIRLAISFGGAGTLAISRRREFLEGSPEEKAVLLAERIRVLLAL